MTDEVEIAGLRASKFGQVVNIAVDIDGVLADFLKQFYRVINRLWPGRIEDGYVQSDWWMSDRMTEEEMRTALDAVFHDPSLWIRLDALPGQHELAMMLHTLSNNNVNVFYVTQRPDTFNGHESALWQTNHWLGRMQLDGPATSTIVVSAAADKSELYRILKIQYSIDDKAETVEQCNLIPGHTAFLLDRSYNQQNQWSQMTQVKDVSTFIRHVLDAVRPQQRAGEK